VTLPEAAASSHFTDNLPSKGHCYLRQRLWSN